MTATAVRLLASLTLKHSVQRTPKRMDTNAVQAV